MNHKSLIIWIIIITILTACNNDEQPSDAFGNFEAEPVMVSSQMQGKLLSLNVSEGNTIEAGAVVGVVDTMQLALQKVQLQAAKKTAATKIGTIKAQAEALQIQINNLEREYQRVLRLSEDGAATDKQKDDLAGNINHLKAQKKSVETQKATVFAEIQSIDAQLLLIQDQITKSFVINPVTGTVLQTYKRQGENTAPTQSIYKIADMNFLLLRAYVSGNQLSSIETGKEVTVRIDGLDGIIELPGTITWIASSAEFTPKVIQTREERVNLVYAIKVKVNNDGRLKIGMPGEVVF